MEGIPQVSMTGGELAINGALSLVLAACVVGGVYGLAWLGFLPGRVADERGHPRAAAIKICSWSGILVVTFPLWLVALVWAYSYPVPATPPRAETC